MLDDIVNDINKKFGKGSIFRLDDESHLNVPRISTGSIALDQAIGGGVPEGRIIEIYGKPSSGKTTIMCHVLAEAQRKCPDKYVAIIDVEHALDKNYTEAIGVDLSRTVIAQPSTAEEAWLLVEDIIKRSEFSAVFVDSIAAMSPRAEIDGEIGDAHIAVGARLNGQAMRKVNPLLKQHKTLLLLANQLRENISTFGYAEKHKPPGGNAIPFYASMILEVARKRTNKDKGEAVSNRTIVKVKKNKTAPPFREAEFDIVYGIGIDKSSELIDYGVEFNLISKRGANYYFIDFETGEISEDRHKSKMYAIEHLNNNLDYRNQLEQAILGKLQ